MGAVGALVMAAAHRRLSFDLLKQAMDSTLKLTSFVVFILIGSTVFSLAFRGLDGDRWVEGLLTGLPGGVLGFLPVLGFWMFPAGLAIFSLDVPPLRRRLDRWLKNV